MVFATSYPRIHTLQESAFEVAGYSAVTPEPSCEPSWEPKFFEVLPLIVIDCHPAVHENRNNRIPRAAILNAEKTLGTR